MSDKIVFSKKPPREFYSAVRKRVNAHFKEKNRSKHADWRMVLKIIFLLGTITTAYLLLMVGQPTFWPSMLLWMVIGSFAAFIGMGISHDAIHGALSGKKWVNTVLSKTFNVLGANDYMWSIMHNIVHHTYTNINEVDEDIHLAPILRMSPHQEHKPIHRYQHFFAFFLYSLSSLSWVFLKDYKKFAQKKIGNYDNKTHETKQYFNLYVYKFIYYFLFIGVPFAVLPLAWWQILIGFVTMHFFEGFPLGITFVLAHEVECADFPIPDQNGTIENNWAVHQMYTTANFAVGHPIVSFFSGGLNQQVEHHLFPKVCHIHYPDIAHIVKATAEEFEVPYLNNETMSGAVASHYRLLKKFGEGMTYEPPTVPNAKRAVA